MIEFGQLMSDMPSFQNRGSMKVDNVIPLPKGYKSFPSFKELTSTALTSACVGLHTQLSGTGTTNYAGDATKLYQMNSSLVFIDKSKVGGYNNSTTEKSRDFWDFTQFGKRIVATNGADNIQSFVEGTSSVFADLVSLKAKYVATIREFVFAGYTTESGTEYSNRVRWSGINDPTSWTASQTTMSDFQDIPDSGVIQGIVGGESFGVIFTDKAIYRCSFVGTPLIFQFDKVADVGCFQPRTIASFGSDIFFLAQDGFYKLTNGTDLQPIGVGKINEFFFQDLSSNFEGICSAVDSNNSIICWSYRGANSSGASTVNNKMLVYNYTTDSWSTCSGQDLEFIATASQEAFSTLESLDVLGSVDDLQYSLDSFAWDEGILSLAGCSSNHKFGKFMGGSMTATVDTTEFEGAEGKRSTLINARPIVDANGENTTITVTPLSRPSQANAVTTGTAVTVKSSGDCPLRTNSRYHRLRVIVDGNFINMQGVDVDARPEGKR
tara:strand:+ start:283 stop:1764 length:1482 start_codon:yes stop_codon:yes gene_type:complete